MEDRYYTEEWMPKLFAGERPSEDILGASPMLDNWVLNLSVDENWYLCGRVFTYPRFTDGMQTTTSRVFWMDPLLQYARTKNRWYRLASPPRVMT